MWDPPSGMGAANTSVAILTLTAVFTPKDKGSGIAGKAIMAAVQAASEGVCVCVCCGGWGGVLWGAWLVGWVVGVECGE
jgi:hypothetical protein